MSLEGGEGDQRPAKRRKLKLSLTKSANSKGSASPIVNFSSEIDGEATGDDEAYFSANFKSICRTVLSGSSPERHVFTDHEIHIVKMFMDLPSKYEPLRIFYVTCSLWCFDCIGIGVQQQLYVRLFLRKHQWLRVDKLKYDCIAEDLTPVAAGLVANAFLSNGSCIIHVCHAFALTCLWL